MRLFLTVLSVCILAIAVPLALLLLEIDKAYFRKK